MKSTPKPALLPGSIRTVLVDAAAENDEENTLLRSLMLLEISDRRTRKAVPLIAVTDDWTSLKKMEAALTLRRLTAVKLLWLGPSRAPGTLMRLRSKTTPAIVCPSKAATEPPRPVGTPMVR